MDPSKMTAGQRLGMRGVSVPKTGEWAFCAADSVADQNQIYRDMEAAHIRNRAVRVSNPLGVIARYCEAMETTYARQPSEDGLSPDWDWKPAPVLRRPVGRQQERDWEALADGDTHVLRFGDDFDCKPESIIHGMKKHCRDNDLPPPATRIKGPHNTPGIKGTYVMITVSDTRITVKDNDQFFEDNGYITRDQEHYA